MSSPAEEPTARRGVRLAALLLLLGLAVEALSLLALHRPSGFLSFALVAGTLIVAGIGVYVWGLVVD
jgi:hypothetical protein